MRLPCHTVNRADLRKNAPAILIGCQHGRGHGADELRFSASVDDRNLASVMVNDQQPHSIDELCFGNLVADEETVCAADRPEMFK